MAPATVRAVVKDRLCGRHRDRAEVPGPSKATLQSEYERTRGIQIRVGRARRGTDWAASMAWLRALSQPIPQAWELREEQEANDAAGEEDLVLNEKLDAR